MSETYNFEQHVVDSLARLETQLDSLTGSEGRVTKLETVTFRLVIGLVGLAVLTLGPAAFLALLR